MRNKIAIILVLSIITIHGYILGLSNAKEGILLKMPLRI